MHFNPVLPTAVVRQYMRAFNLNRSGGNGNRETLLRILEEAEGKTYFVDIYFIGVKMIHVEVESSKERRGLEIF